VEFAQVVGSRRSIRWYRPWQPVEPAAVQRILEAARLAGSPGNLQPWRAVVVLAAELPAGDRSALLDAANRQRSHEQAPVWIYWFADPSAVAPAAFLEQILLGLRIGMLSSAAGWDGEAARAAIEEGVPAPPGMAPLHEIAHGLPPELAAVVAMQETNAACAVAVLAAVDAELGTCLHVPAMPSEHAVVKARLGVPDHFIPVWLQLVGHPAEDPRAGGQRPRKPFEELFALGRWGTPFPRDPAVAAALEREGLLQPQAPLPGRIEELAHLARTFGYPHDGRGAR
jgi:nitroreductase